MTSLCQGCFCLARYTVWPGKTVLGTRLARRLLVFSIFYQFVVSSGLSKLFKIVLFRVKELNRNAQDDPLSPRPVTVHGNNSTAGHMTRITAMKNKPLVCRITARIMHFHLIYWKIKMKRLNIFLILFEIIVLSYLRL